jgi:hypothetical protein
MNRNTKILLCLLGLAIVAYFVYNLNKKESFSIDGSINGGVPLGGIVNNTYDIIQPSVNSFADIVSPSQPLKNTVPLPVKAGLETDYRDLLPDVNTSATMYDIDVSDPEVFMFRPSIRTTIHNRQWEGADPLRGDLPITKDSCGLSNNGWFSSRYGEGDIAVDKYFSNYGQEKIRSLMGQKSYPQNIANEETIMDFSRPAESGDQATMDWY